MNRHRLLGSLVIALSLCGSTMAGDYWGNLCGIKACIPDCVKKWCCDDYCPKPEPCVRPVTCFTCPDYCPKPEPCVCPVTCFCCPDYCPKPLPCLSCCPPTPGLTCGWPRCGNKLQGTAGPRPSRSGTLSPLTK